MLCVYCITKTVSVVPDPLVGYMYRCYTVPVRRRLDQSSVCNYVCSGCAVQFSNLKLICSCSCSLIHCSSVDTIAASLCSICCVETLWAESLISHLYCIQRCEVCITNWWCYFWFWVSALILLTCDYGKWCEMLVIALGIQFRICEEAEC